MGQQLRDSGGASWDVAASQDHWVRVTLSTSTATIASIREVYIPAGELVILTSDGVHDSIPAEELEDLVRVHQTGQTPDDVQGLADILVAEARNKGGTEGVRDDATAILLR